MYNQLLIPVLNTIGQEDFSNQIYKMKYFYLFLALFLSQLSFGQYSETFDIDDKGIITAPCTTNDPTSCVLFDFTGVNWTIEGNLSGLDNLASLEDDFKTSGGVFTSSGDIDEEICWVSPVLDISMAGSNVDFNLDVTYTGLDNTSTDYVDVQYNINGGSWTTAQPNLVGTGGRTINSGTGSTNVAESGLSGNTLQIRVCTDFNSQSENFSIDNVNVPDANVTILPVTLVSFTAEQAADRVLLEWVTNSELNNEKFEIETSENARDFYKTGEVKGSGTTTEKQEYSFEIKNPLNGIHYYRLKQIDYNGHFEYSKLISVNFRVKNKQIGKLYPNPNKTGLVNLEFTSSKDDEITVSIFDKTGRFLFSRIQEVSEGSNNLIFDFSSLNTGIYIVKIESKSNPAYRKLVIN